MASYCLALQALARFCLGRPSHQMNATFFSIKSGDITSKLMKDGENMVQTLFAVACCLQPSVVFLD